MTSSQSSNQGAPCLLQLSPTDNVCVVTRSVEAGSQLRLQDKTLVVKGQIPLGHKIAAAPIRHGQKVVKYGLPIGSATCDIAPGEHVHTHNMKSDYIQSFTYRGSDPFVGTL